MATLIERVKRANKRVVCLINGYSKQISSSLQKNNVIIPELVIYWIIAFYYYPEYFTNHGSHIKVYDSGTVAAFTKSNNNDFNTVYGNLKISKQETNDWNKFVWEFKIINPSSKLVIAIGLSSDDKSSTDTAFDDSAGNNLFYSFEDNGSKTYINYAAYERAPATTREDLEYNCNNYGTRFTLGHENNVIMEWDTKQEILKYYVNGQDQGIAVITKIYEKEFIAAISMNDSVTIELVSFDRTKITD